MKIAKSLGIIVTTVGIVVMAGWIFDIGILKSILPFWVTMKFTTAFSFLLSGITLYFIVDLVENESEIARVILPITLLIILLLMATLLISTFLGIRTGIEDLFVRESEGAVKTVTPGRPSVGTMISFISIAIAGFVAMSTLKKSKPKLRIIGGIISVAGIAAIIGYIANTPFLYYAIGNVSTAMAFHTAILFILLGMGLLLLPGSKNNVD
ncbi:MAG: hypothetical protein NG740_02390 [Omnitrophica bacterium]|nr:hypothetical protein [Candidatus Omnitrophota bacterium]